MELTLGDDRRENFDLPKARKIKLWKTCSISDDLNDAVVVSTEHSIGYKNYQKWWVLIMLAFHSVLASIYF